MLTNNDINSEAKTANHNPVTSNKSGIIYNINIWIANVLKKDMIAEVRPSFKAVKNDDANILNHNIIYDTEYNRKASVVKSNKSLSYPTNILAKKLADKMANTVKMMLMNNNILTLFFNKLFSSFLFPAP